MCDFDFDSGGIVPSCSLSFLCLLWLDCSLGFRVLVGMTDPRLGEDNIHVKPRPVAA